MKDPNIDEILDRAAKAPHQVDPALLGRISASLGATMRPVRPLLPAAQLAALLLLTSAGIALVFAFALGTFGIQKMDVAEIGSIFPALGIFTWLVALVCVAEMTPGGLRWKNPSIMERLMTNPALLLLAVLVLWLAIDVIFFHDYAMDFFASQGIPCLRAGLIVAIPTGISAWLLLRRGFAVNRTAAGLAAGTLAGLAGLLMLELHCPNFHALHIMVWHTAVVPISGLAGALLARLNRHR
jgi:hypothetical protein